MTQKQLEDLAKELTVRFLNEPDSEGFGVELPNIVIAYSRSKKFKKYLKKYLQELNLAEVQFKIKVIGKVSI